MIIQQQKLIKELAQDFMDSPRICSEGNILSIVIDYETDDGTYGEKKIVFFNVIDFRHISEETVTPKDMEAYNCICQVLDSEWLFEKGKSSEFKHFMIYFDEYGLYEILAKNYEY